MSRLFCRLFWPGVHQLLEELIEPGREEIAWADVAAVLTVGKFCGQASELGIAENWYARTALEDLCGIPVESVNDDRLYRALDKVGEHKDRLCQHLMERYRDWFGVSFEFLPYDVTSTCFEGQALGNGKAARGYSRDSRGDCASKCASAWSARRRRSTGRTWKTAWKPGWSSIRTGMQASPTWPIRG